MSIIIKKIYTWYNVYVNNILVLKNLSRQDVTDLLKVDKNGDIKIYE